MARIETSKALVGKTITLMDGTKAKIVGNIASGYNVEGRAKRIATRCVCLQGKNFVEIERTPLSELEVHDGYVTQKDAKAAKAPKTDKKPASNKKPTTEKKQGGKVNRKKVEEVSDEDEPAGDEVRLTELPENSKLVASIVERMTKYAQTTAMLDENGNTILNDYAIAQGSEFTKEGHIQITIGIKYDMTQPEVETTEQVKMIIVDPAVAMKAKSRVGKKCGKKLAKMIESHFEIDVSEFVMGIVLDKDGEEVIVLGPDAEDNDKLRVYVTESGKMRTIGAGLLKNYELVMEEVASSDEEEEEEEEEEEIETDEEEEEEEESESDDDGDDGDDDSDNAEAESMVVALEDEDFEGLDKKATAAFFKKMSKALDTDITHGSVVTNGSESWILVGINEDGDLHVKEYESDDTDLYKFDAEDLSDFLEYEPVMEEAEDSDSDDAMDEDFEENPEDMSDDALRAYVVEQELCTKNRAAKLSRAKLLKLID